jgi:hypothetical protein
MNSTPSNIALDMLIDRKSICDFDELFEDHPALLAEVMASLPATQDLGARRGKFLALREWITLSSAYALPCYRLQSTGNMGDGDLWFKIGQRWIGEVEVDSRLFRTDDPPDGLLTAFNLCLQDELLRWHTSKWLLRIERAFQSWWKNSVEASVVVLLPTQAGMPGRDITELIFGLDPVERSRAVATNSLPGGGCENISGRVFLHAPSNYLREWRRAQELEAQLENDTATSSELSGTGRRL